MFHESNSMASRCIYDSEAKLCYWLSSNFPFLPRDAMLITVYAVIVCLSGTLRYCIKMDKRRIMQIMPSDSPGTLVF